MKPFNNWNIAVKIGATGIFPVFVAILIIITGFSAGMYELENDGINSEKIIFALWQECNNYLKLLNRYLINASPQTSDNIRLTEKRLLKQIEIYTSHKNEYEAFSGQSQLTLHDISKEFKILYETALNSDFDKAAYSDKLDKMQNHINIFFSSKMNNVHDEIAKEIIGVSLLIVFSSLLSIITALYLTRILSRSILDPIKSLCDSNREFGSGSLNTRVTISSGDELGELGSAFNKMADDLQKIIEINKNEIEERKQAEKAKHQLEDRLRQSHKMEAIGTLAGGIAHDFNNILAAIQGYAELANDDISDDSPAKESIQEVLKASNRAKYLIKQIISFSRKETPRFSSVNISEVVKEAMKLLRATIPKTINIKERIDMDCGTIMADETQINQIIINLCTNAAQSIEKDGGEITVGLSAHEADENNSEKVSELEFKRYIILSVQDCGHGIDPKIINNIFDPYFTTKERNKGSGMGLALVYSIIQDHGGAIKVKSEPGKGTEFKVFLPKTDSEEHLPQDEKETDILSLTGKEHILVVDDEPCIVNMTRKRLERVGYKVEVQTDSIKALEHFKSNAQAFDLVITDQTMPGLTGAQLTKELLKIRPDIPVIICTGYSTEINPEQANELGIKAVAMKPVELSQLTTLIQKALSGSGKQF